MLQEVILSLLWYDYNINNIYYYIFFFTSISYFLPLLLLQEKYSTDGEFLAQTEYLLSPGTYSIIAKDSNGCISEVKEYIVPSVSRNIFFIFFLFNFLLNY